MKMSFGIIPETKTFLLLCLLVKFYCDMIQARRSSLSSLGFFQNLGERNATAIGFMGPDVELVGGHVFHASVF